MQNNVITTFSAFVISICILHSYVIAFSHKAVTYMHMRFRLSKIIQQTSNYNCQFTFRPRLIVLVALYQTIKRQMHHKGFVTGINTLNSECLQKFIVCFVRVEFINRKFQLYTVPDH